MEKIKTNTLFVPQQNSGSQDHGQGQVWLGITSFTSYQQSLWAYLGEAETQTQEHRPWSQNVWIQTHSPHLRVKTYTCVLELSNC